MWNLDKVERAAKAEGHVAYQSRDRDIFEVLGEGRILVTREGVSVDDYYHE